jgi:ribose 5-phosphate isomerase B
MAESFDVREIARRAAGRALAERGREEHPVAHPARVSVPGVLVTIQPVTVQPAAIQPAAIQPPPPARAEPARELVTAADVAVATGGTLGVRHGALVTPAAQDEARRRGVRIVAGSSESPGRLRVAVGADHGGFALKKDVLAWVGELGHVAVDLGARDDRPADYPDLAHAVAEAVASGQCELGIVIDGAGIGSAIAANKVPGVRAATCCDAAMARNAREHNFANVLSLGGRTLGRSVAHDVVRTFLATATGEERHARRVTKITAIEARYSRSPGRPASR